MRDVVSVAVLHTDRLEFTDVFNDPLGWCGALGDYRTGVRTIPLTEHGDVLVLNEGAVNLGLAENGFASAFVDWFRPGHSGYERLHGPAFVARACGPDILDARKPVLEAVVRFARGLALDVVGGQVWDADRFRAPIGSR
jgi:hypothetical protein